MILNSYKDLIGKLVNNKYTPLLNNFYISMYLDVTQSNRSDIQTKLNSYLNKGFKRIKKLDEEDKLRQKIQKKIRKKLRGITGFEKGLAIFVGFSKENEEIDVNIANLNLTPEDDVFIGKVYNLDQLLWTYNQNREILILDLDETNFNIHYLAGEKIEKLKSYSNEFLETKEKESLGEFRPVDGKSKIMFGKGEQKTERRKDQTLTHFFDWSLNNLLDEEFFQEFNLKYLLIFHSTEYNEIADDIKEQIKARIKLEPIMLSKINTESVKLKKVVKEEINRVKKENKEELLKESKSVPGRYAQGWEEVTKAARFAKIDTLFLKLKLKEKGYIATSDMIYAKEHENTTKVDNIEPWLVMDTHKKGGDVRIIRQDDDVLEDDISAKLRY